MKKKAGTIWTGSRSDLFLLAEGDRDRDSVHIS